jgi:hypothetical protein
MGEMGVACHNSIKPCCVENKKGKGREKKGGERITRERDHYCLLSISHKRQKLLAMFHLN